MNSKERVKIALSGKEPDKIPFGEFAIDYDTVERILGHETYLRAKAKSQIAFWEGRRDEVVQSWKEDALELFRQLDFMDIINCNAIAFGVVPPKDFKPNPPKKLDDSTWEDEEGRIYKLSEITMDITMVHDPKRWDRRYEPADYEKDPECTAPDPSIFEVVDFTIGQFGNEKYILGPSGNSVGMVSFGDMERTMMEYAMNPELVKAAAHYYYQAGSLEDHYFIREGQDGVLWGQDYAFKSGPFISPEMFREFVFPTSRLRVKDINEKFGIPVWMHACGNNWKLMDMFIRIGYCCYQSIQPTAGMDIKEVKQKYGDKICLWGGIPVEHLVGGTREDIKKDVRYAVESAKRGGGYIFGSSHSIAVGTRYDNFLSMVDEFLRVRSY